MYGEYIQIWDIVRKEVYGIHRELTTLCQDEIKKNNLPIPRVTFVTLLLRLWGLSDVF